MGFRADWGGASDGFTLQGDAYDGRLEQDPQGTADIAGMNLLARWSRAVADGSSIRVQGYYDQTKRDIPALFGENLDILDLELQHSIRPLGAHEVVWGGGYRHANDSVTNSATLAFIPADRSLQWANLLVQYGIALRGNRRRLSHRQRDRGQDQRRRGLGQLSGDSGVAAERRCGAAETTTGIETG